MILAGGLGTRAKPFTLYSPKAMIPVNDRPIVDYIIRYVSKFAEVDEVIVAGNFMNGGGLQIKHYFEGKESLIKAKLRFVQDRIEGTAGGVLSAASFLHDDEDFFVWFSDNLCPLDLSDLLRYHRSKGGIGCVTVRRVKREETGFAEVTKDGRITRFDEKPAIRMEKAECLAMYVFNTDILNYIEKAAKGKRSVNLSYDVLQKLPTSEKLFAYDVRNLPWLDVESPSKIERNLKHAQHIITRMESYKARAR
ncbi:MAG: nucleotidyltransferase family protein [Candidatus Bathyarchaeia archaeon]